MPIQLQTGDSPFPEDVPKTPADMLKLRPVLPNYMGCQILTRMRAYLMDQGCSNSLYWQLHDRTGLPLDPEYVGWGAVKVRVRFTPLGQSGPLICKTATMEPDNAPWFYVEVPACVYSAAGLYRVEWALEDSGGKLIFVNKSILSVESNSFGESQSGPPTIGEIRTRLHDTNPQENHVLYDTEFKEDEIFEAILAPIRYWNEQPPDIGSYSLRNFPFKENWINATIAKLYEFAANHQRRQKWNISAAGVTGQDKDREKDYMAISKYMWDEWKDFVRRKKIEFNFERGFDVIGSGLYD